MKYRILAPMTLLVAVFAACAPCSAQEAAQETDPDATNADPAEPTAVPAWQMNFENLSPEKKKEYSQLIAQTSQLFNQKRIFEALNKALEAEAIFDENPGALNLKGACYVEFRDFDKARQFFNEALALAPESPNVLFNLVEMDFVTGKWQDCETRILQLLPNIDPRNASMKRLVEFKLLLAKIKLGKMDEARELADKYDYLDDYPYYYYAQAAMAYHDEKLTEAERWLGSARRVFRNPNVLAPWQDTLIEFGYIKSFYGTDLSEEEVGVSP